MDKKIICGLDEAGRGALAGPLVAAAVTLSPILIKEINKSNLKIKDSKLLKSDQRLKIYDYLIKIGCEINIEVTSSRIINNHGIGKANKEIFRKLIRKVNADKYIVDGNLRLGRIMNKTHKIKSVVDADAKYLPAILAGIVAKVFRDKLMHRLHRHHPKYNWRKNMGYGTKKHLEALRIYGSTRFHRLIFVTTALKNP